MSQGSPTTFRRRLPLRAASSAFNHTAGPKIWRSDAVSTENAS